MTRLRKFRHRFRGGSIAEVTVDVDRLQEDDWTVSWSGRKPRPRIVPEYRRWSLLVLQQLADETGLKILKLPQVKPHVWESWIVEPDKPPVKVGDLDTRRPM